MKTFFKTRALNRMLAGSLALCASPGAHSADRLFYFVDEHGVSHFSNVPADARYQPLPGTGAPALPEPRIGSAPIPTPMPELASPVEPAPWSRVEPPGSMPGEPLPDEVVPQEGASEDVEIRIEPDDR